MENLARTAGYPDPIRLQWAMEAQEIADLAKGPVVVDGRRRDGRRWRSTTTGQPQT